MKARPVGAPDHLAELLAQHVGMLTTELRALREEAAAREQWFREQLTYERARANVAVDQLLQRAGATAGAAGLAPVTPGPPPGWPEAGNRLAEEIRTLVQQDDFARAGDPEGVGR